MFSSKIGEPELRNVKKYERGLIIHHWDTDGISSAALLLQYLRKVKSELAIENYTPPIGNYRLSDDEIEKIGSKNYQFIIIVDINLPKNNILKLKEYSKAEVFYFDHHIQERIEEVHHLNPLIEGINGEKYPSASWFLNCYLNNSVTLPAVLGAVADHETRIKDKKEVYRTIGEYLEKSGLSFNDLLRMVELIDTNYKVGDREGVLKAPYTLLENDSRIILENPVWNKNLEVLRKEVEEQTSIPPTRREGKILIWDINTPHNITSTVTRRLAWKNNDSIVVVINRGWFPDRDQVYMRSGNKLFDSQELINFAHSLGYDSGGKEEVFAAVVPKSETEKLLEILLKRLKRGK
ncbi:MAG: DHH family phosphoesterase [Candidatus Freyarchaeota archaeon]|nr:DHH family phosphoesterase [Candidatus Jordarchaeia archaeon]MBS7270055.1 DHH family phosphoesterase [Candidatus Jordarchaeia archaeon]MBS7278335.1 DHH family phosphoesterase [Candidatus Jordarchaeia archaeon]